jgi:hypothetical protein
MTFRHPLRLLDIQTIERASISAVIQPAVPPPTIKIRRKVGGSADFKAVRRIDSSGVRL